MIATHASLESEPCKEEFAYALQRALTARGANYPVIGLFLGPVESSLIPLAIKTRLYVSVTDSDWKERIVAAAEGRPHNISSPTVAPYYLKLHTAQGGERPFVIEVRPRAGVWAPFIACIPAGEQPRVDPSIMIGPRDLPTDSGMLINTGTGISEDGALWMFSAGNQATPNDSYYIWCKELPSSLIFGVSGRPPQYRVELTATPRI